MEFALTSEQNMYRQSYSEFLSKECPVDSVTKSHQNNRGYSTSVWKKMAGLGWLGLVHEEKYGGMDGSFLDLFILFEEIGKVLLPSPLFISPVLCGWLLKETGDTGLIDAYLPALIDGKKILSLALQDERGTYDADNPKIKAVKTEAGTYRINGTRLFVPYAGQADEIIFCVSLPEEPGSGPTLFRTNNDAAGLEQTALPTLTGEKTYALVFGNVELPAENIVGEIGQGNDYLNSVIPKATVLKCGEMLGGLERVVEMTVGYVKGRQQFGRPLGTLQAVQHQCADMSVLLEATRVIAYQAACLMSEGKPCQKEVAMAKAWCNDAYRKTTWIGQQLHGGIGFTEEYPLHLFYKHAKTSELAFESSWFHRRTVADEMGFSECS
jgi:alkylation response protein AidB-like acyl-CoA dehydrogenase